MNEAEKKILANIEEHGCHVTSVFDPEEKNPTFTYTTGIYKSQSAPELIVMGFRPELGSWVANEYCRQVEKGTIFEIGEFYSGFLDGFDICFMAVSDVFKKEFMLSSCWLYHGAGFDALQLVYPTVDGGWPWEDTATDSFKKLQPSLQGQAEW